MELVKYILGDISHFLGFLIILYVVLEGIIGIIEAFKSKDYGKTNIINRADAAPARAGAGHKQREYALL